MIKKLVLLIILTIPYWSKFDNEPFVMKKIHYENALKNIMNKFNIQKYFYDKADLIDIFFGSKINDQWEKKILWEILSWINIHENFVDNLPKNKEFFKFIDDIKLDEKKLICLYEKNDYFLGEDKRKILKCFDLDIIKDGEDFYNFLKQNLTDTQLKEYHQLKQRAIEEFHHYHRNISSDEMDIIFKKLQEKLNIPWDNPKLRKHLFVILNNKKINIMEEYVIKHHISDEISHLHRILDGFENLKPFIIYLMYNEIKKHHYQENLKIQLLLDLIKLHYNKYYAFSDYDQVVIKINDFNQLSHKDLLNYEKQLENHHINAIDILFFFDADQNEDIYNDITDNYLLEINFFLKKDSIDHEFLKFDNFFKEFIKSYIHRQNVKTKYKDYPVIQKIGCYIPLFSKSYDPSHKKVKAMESFMVTNLEYKNYNYIEKKNRLISIFLNNFPFVNKLPKFSFHWKIKLFNDGYNKEIFSQMKNIIINHIAANFINYKDLLFHKSFINDVFDFRKDNILSEKANKFLTEELKELKKKCLERYQESSSQLLSYNYEEYCKNFQNKLVPYISITDPIKILIKIQYKLLKDHYKDTINKFFNIINNSLDNQSFYSNFIDHNDRVGSIKKIIKNLLPKINNQYHINNKRLFLYIVNEEMKKENPNDTYRIKFLLDIMNPNRILPHPAIKDYNFIPEQELNHINYEHYENILKENNITEGDIIIFFAYYDIYLQDKNYTFKTFKEFFNFFLKEYKDKQFFINNNL